MFLLSLSQIYDAFFFDNYVITILKHIIAAWFLFLNIIIKPNSWGSLNSIAKYCNTLVLQPSQVLQ